MSTEWEFRIAKLDLQRGDILVVKQMNGFHPKADYKFLSTILPAGVRILEIPHDIELSVLTKDEIDAKAV